MARAAAATAATVALGLTAACSGSSPSDPDASATTKPGKPDKADGTDQAGKPSSPKSPSSSSSPSPSAPAPGKPLSKAELNKAALTQGDLDDYAIGAMPDEESAPGEERADQEECKPLTSVISGAPEPKATDTVYRQIIGTRKDKKKPMQQMVITEFLTAHKPKDAPKVLADLRAAIKECAGGFTSYGPEGDSKYSSVKELPAHQAGDDSLAYQVTGDLNGESVPLVFHVIRSGTTVATFYTANLVDAKTPDLPADVVKKQAEKLT